MKRLFLFAITATLLSCGSKDLQETNTVLSGVHAGAIVGGAIGGIVGGYMGGDVRAVAGAMGGAVATKAILKKQRMNPPIGSSIGEARRLSKKLRNINEEFDTIHPRPRLKINHLQLIDPDNDSILTRGEEWQVAFEIRNDSDIPALDVRPFVKHYYPSPYNYVTIAKDQKIEEVSPHQTVKYTSALFGEKKLGKGEIKIEIGVSIGESEVVSQTITRTIPTEKRPAKKKQ